MGQRLNLEIKTADNHELNVYYHWSGYTRASLEKVVPFINSKGTVAEVLSILYATGAAVTYDDEELVQSLVPSVDHRFAEDRNKGVISFSEDSKETTRSAPTVVFVDLKTCMVNAQGAFATVAPKSERHRKEEIDYDYEYEDYADYGIMKLNTMMIPLDELPQFIEGLSGMDRVLLRCKGVYYVTVE